METNIRVTIETEDGTKKVYEAIVPVDENDPASQKKAERVVHSGLEVAFALLDAKFREL